jgi:hypothetical protein
MWPHRHYLFYFILFYLFLILFYLFYFILFYLISCHFVFFYFIAFHFTLFYPISFNLFYFYLISVFPEKGESRPQFPARMLPRTFSWDFHVSVVRSPAAKMRWILSENHGFLTIAEAPGSTGGVQYLVGTMSRVAMQTIYLSRRGAPAASPCATFDCFASFFFGSWAVHFPDFLGGFNPPQIR